MRITSRLVVSTLLVLLGITHAAAQVGCGDTIAAGEKVVLTQDIAGCPHTTSPALTITGPAKVDMAGFRVSCEPDPNEPVSFDPNDPNNPVGILLEGKGVKLSNGGVVGCGTGLVLGGAGSHKIEAFASESAPLIGVIVESDKNKLKNVTSNDNGQRGFEVRGDKNKFENIAAAFNENDGFHVTGNANQVKRALFASNESDGLEFDGDGNKGKDCFSVNNRFEGLELDGNDNKIEKSIVTEVGDPNEVAPDPEDVGVEIEGDGNQVKNVLANDNRSSGIVTTAVATNAKISKNVAFGNVDADLQDRVAGGTCGTNQWKSNTFGTAFADNDSDPECIE